MNSPTLTSAQGTQLGVILGTAGYMSPEQAHGGTVVKRADILAFGVVFSEMLTARRLFEGDTVSDTLAAVLRQEIDWRTLAAATPAPLRRLLRPSGAPARQAASSPTAASGDRPPWPPPR